MRHRLVYCLLAAIAGSPVAYADITIDFSTPVNTVSFYSSEPDNLTANTNGSSPLHLTVNSGYTLGAVTLFADTNVTAVDFSGTPDEYVLDDFTYSVGSNTYVLNFDDPALVQGDSVGSFYAGWTNIQPGCDYPDGSRLQRLRIPVRKLPKRDRRRDSWPIPNCNARAWFLPPSRQRVGRVGRRGAPEDRSERLRSLYKTQRVGCCKRPRAQALGILHV